MDAVSPKCFIVHCIYILCILYMLIHNVHRTIHIFTIHIEHRTTHTNIAQKNSLNDICITYSYFRMTVVQEAKTYWVKETFPVQALPQTPPAPRLGTGKSYYVTLVT